MSQEWDAFIEEQKKKEEGSLHTEEKKAAQKQQAQKKRNSVEMGALDSCDSDNNLLLKSATKKKSSPAAVEKTKNQKKPADLSDTDESDDELLPAPKEKSSPASEKKRKTSSTPVKTPTQPPKRPTKSARKDPPSKRKVAIKLAAVTKTLSPAPKVDYGRCNHGSEPWVNFHLWDQSYYKSEWLESADMETYPMDCKRCDRVFVAKPKTEVDKVREVKVTKACQGTCHSLICVATCQTILTCFKPVHVFPNGTKNNHHCTYALCKPCVDALCVACHSPAGKKNSGNKKPAKRATRGDSRTKRKLTLIK